jgi:hypothetical protein
MIPFRFEQRSADLKIERAALQKTMVVLQEKQGVLS